VKATETRRAASKGGRASRSGRPSQIALASIVMATGVLLPIFFHQVGLGPVFLPMFLPISLGAFFLRPAWAFAVGFFTPIVSSLATGMPPWMPPVAPVLCGELSIFSVAISLLYRAGLQPLLALGLALLLNRLLLLVIATALAPLLGLPPSFTGISAVIFGLPGVLLMLIVVPIVLPRLATYLEV